MKGFLNNRLQCALTGQPLHRFKNVDRIGDDFRHSIEYNNSLQAIGLRIVWNFRNRTHIRVNTVEGGQTYNERKEE